MAHVSNKLKNSFEGALAGGGDPATSPLYVFGPFLKLIVVAGVARVTFGASIWLVVLTIAVVSGMYRLVMKWVTDGSGGSGLSEEEFGGWAVKINAAITFVEYTLTFLVSMSAMVTFIADRVPVLNEKILWFQYRTIVAIGLSILTGWLVNRGPRMAARTFGPATGGVLILLWAMVIATIFKEGFHLPDLNFTAFTRGYIHFTLGGYVRILAVMTGIEVFANLVAAYDGKPEEKSQRAFNSLLIIMGTTAITMLIVGPAIYELSNPLNSNVSVFTQTMDRLLPAPLPYFGTIVGIAVLMSASAASAQGLQNLALGLRERRYVPPVFGRRNRFDVADKPVWLEVGIVGFCFLFFGTNEETYLSLYAAGVFILLSMTGWAVTKRLLREIRSEFAFNRVTLVAGTIVAATLTTASTAIIFEERFLEGAWTYFLFIPILYAFFTMSRSRLGAPTPEMDYLGLLDAAQLAGFGFGQVPVKSILPSIIRPPEPQKELAWQPEPKERSQWRDEHIEIQNAVVLLDGSEYAAQALPLAKAVQKATGAKLTLLSAVKNHTPSLEEQYSITNKQREAYLYGVVDGLELDPSLVEVTVQPGSITNATINLIEKHDVDLVITSTRGKSGAKNWLTGGVTRKLVNQIYKPILLAQVDGKFIGTTYKLGKILVALDGSIKSEKALPYARAFAEAFGSELVLLSVPEVPEVKDYRAAADVVKTIRQKAEANMKKFLNAVARSLREDGIKVKTIVTGSRAARTIVMVGKEEAADLIIITSRGRGELDYLLLGSVAEQVVEQTDLPVLIIPVH
ncbi:MAG: universal stress protein [Anaerolineales bacterium]|nr:universal stress protein [Anaerolineales bacterium]HEY62022.1 universal stress protein [Anaerolineae bacterium]